MAITDDSESTYSSLNVGDQVTVTVSTSEKVTPSSSGKIKLDIGGTEVDATYSNSDADGLKHYFTYTLQATQDDANGISIVADSITDWTLTDEADNVNSSLTNTVETDNVDYVVDNTAPTLSSITSSATSLKNNGETTLTFSFTEVVSNLTVSDLYYGAIAGTNFSNLVSSDDGKTWTATYKNTSTGNSSAKFSVKANSFSDTAGNTNASVTESSTVTIDNTAPDAQIYRANLSGTTLTFTGIGFNSLLQTGEGSSFDIKSRLDWGKLSYDFDSDNALGTTTNDMAFAVGDISSAKVTADGTLTVVLKNAMANSITDHTQYGRASTAKADSFDVQAGFLKDAAGNAATTDGKNNAYGDVIDLGAANGKLIAPITLTSTQVNGGPKTYYYWDYSGNGASTEASGAGYNQITDKQTHDALDLIFKNNSSGVANAGTNTNNNFRYGTLMGISLALPTSSDGSGNLENNANTNMSNDFAAIWDVRANSKGGNGTPNLWGSPYYWAATQTGSNNHIFFNMSAGTWATNGDNATYYVAVQVL